MIGYKLIGKIVCDGRIPIHGAADRFRSCEAATVYEEETTGNTVSRVTFARKAIAYWRRLGWKVERSECLCSACNRNDDTCPNCHGTGAIARVIKGNRERTNCRACKGSGKKIAAGP